MKDHIFYKVHNSPSSEGKSVEIRELKSWYVSSSVLTTRMRFGWLEPEVLLANNATSCQPNTTVLKNCGGQARLVAYSLLWAYVDSHGWWTAFLLSQQKVLVARYRRGNPKFLGNHYPLI